MDGHDADQIVFRGKNDRSESPSLCNRLLHAIKNALLLLTQGMTVDPVIRDDGKLRCVNRIGPLAQNLALRSLLATAHEEFPRILKIGVLLGVIGREYLRSAQWGPIAREHVSDLALTNGHEVGFVNSIGEGKEDVNSATQNLGLEPSLTMERDEARFDRAFRRPHFFYDSDLIVRDVPKNIAQAQNH